MLREGTSATTRTRQVVPMVRTRQGEFSPGFPFAYVADPDGYEIEIWYE